jgi:hypothetical protein
MTKCPPLKNNFFSITLRGNFCKFYSILPVMSKNHPSFIIMSVSDHNDDLKSIITKHLLNDKTVSKGCQ